jgi:hypothetical protein
MAGEIDRSNLDIVALQEVVSQNALTHLCSLLGDLQGCFWNFWLSEPLNNFHRQAFIWRQSADCKPWSLGKGNTRQTETNVSGVSYAVLHVN